MVAALLPLVEQCAGAAHELEQQRSPFDFAARAEVETEAHPIEFDTVEVVALAVFFDETEVVVADCGMSEVKGAVAPVDCSPGDTAVFGVFAPERAVHVAVGVVHVVKVVHAHGDPGGESMAAGAGDPELVGVMLCWARDQAVCTHLRALGRPAAAVERKSGWSSGPAGS